MAHFAELDENNSVKRVIVVNNDVILEDGFESEAKGIAFCQNLFGNDTIWKQTSYNGTFRKHFASVNYTFDTIRDAFIPSKLYSSWILDEETCIWVSPVPMPEDGNVYQWSEKVANWISKPDSGLWEWNYIEEVWQEFTRQ